DNGLVVCFRASSSRLQQVGQCPGPVAALATTMGGDLVVAACSFGDSVDLRAFTRQTQQEFQPAGIRMLEGPRATGLAPLIASFYGETFTIVRSGPALDDLTVLRGADLLPRRTGVHEEDDDWPIDLPLPKEVPGVSGIAVLVLVKGGINLCWLNK